MGFHVIRSLKLSLAAAMLLTVVCWQPLVDRIAGRPSPEVRLFNAITSQDLRGFEAALADGASPTAQSLVGGSPLMAAACVGNVQITRRLLALDADVNGADDCGFTALMWAASQNQAAEIRFLISAGADVSARNRQGLTALDMAIAREAPEAEKVLRCAQEANGPDRKLP
jgi:ankyrin repeat protein